MNSLTHAFEGRASGNIHIDAERITADRLRLTYRDDGCGIPEALRSKVFEPFVTSRRNAGGSGLGLNIVFNLVTRTLGGSITLADSASPGTTWVIDFPVGAGNTLE